MVELSYKSFIIMLLFSDLLGDRRVRNRKVPKFDDLLRMMSSATPRTLKEYLMGDAPIDLERSIEMLKKRCQDLNKEGIWITTVIEPNYPKSLKNKLNKRAPKVMFYSGDLEILDMDGLAIVGSRDANEEALEIAKKLGKACARDGLVVFSGGARGVDTAAERSCLENGGRVVSFLSCEMRRKIKNREVRKFIDEGRLLIVSTVNPDARFSVRNAMERNKYIYCASKAAIVVAADIKGGTWSGAKENSEKRYVPMFVVKYPTMPRGNAELLKEYKTVVRELDASFVNENFSPRKSILERIDLKSGAKKMDRHGPDIDGEAGRSRRREDRNDSNTDDKDGQLELFDREN